MTTPAVSPEASRAVVEASRIGSTLILPSDLYFPSGEQAIEELDLDISRLLRQTRFISRWEEFRRNLVAYEDMMHAILGLHPETVLVHSMSDGFVTDRRKRGWPPGRQREAYFAHSVLLPFEAGGLLEARGALRLERYSTTITHECRQDAYVSAAKYLDPDNACSAELFDFMRNTSFAVAEDFRRMREEALRR